MDLLEVDHSGAYFLYHDANGRLGMADNEAQIPAGATHVHRISKDGSKGPGGLLSQLKEMLPFGAQQAIPAPVQELLEKAHMSPLVGIGVVAAFIVVFRNSFLRMLAIKFAFGIMALAIVGGGYMMMLGKTTHTDNGTMSPTAVLQAAQENAEAMRQANERQAQTLDAIANDAH